MIWITWMFAGMVIVWQVAKIVLEQTVIESRTSYALDWIISSILVLGHYGWVNYAGVSDGVILLCSLGLALLCFAASVGASFIGMEVLGFSDEPAELEPWFILTMAFFILAIFIPTGGSRLLGFPTLFQNYHYVWIVALVGEAILLILHFWLNYEWDWEQTSMMIHWVLSSLLLLGLFAWVYSLTNDRHLSWMMALILCLMIHLERVSGLLLGKLWGDLLAISPAWYGHEIMLFVGQMLGISLIYIAPILLGWIRKVL